MATKIVSGNPYKISDLGIDDEDGLVWGVYVGGCIDDGGAWRLWREQHGHAHNDTTDPWFGWICIIEPKDVLTKTGRPTGILLHEFAHMLCPNQGHNAAWKKAVTALGASREIKRVAKIKPKNRMPSVARARREKRKELQHAASRLR